MLCLEESGATPCRARLATLAIRHKIETCEWCDGRGRMPDYTGCPVCDLTGFCDADRNFYGAIRVTQNDLSAEVEHWDDPGDYPNNIASRPLPSREYIRVDGSVTIEFPGIPLCLIEKNEAQLREVIREYLSEEDLDEIDGIARVAAWGGERRGAVFTAEPECWVEVEHEPDYDTERVRRRYGYRC